MKFVSLLACSLRVRCFQRFVIAILFPGMMTLSSPVKANPSGGVVVNGAVEFGDGLNGHLSILQNTDKAIINWDQFSIQAGETTQFVQPGANSAVLNRVVSGNPTAIHGALQANGKVFVINPNGILVGPSGRIDVGGLVLSTLDVSDADFLGGGDMLFKGDSSAGVTNMGRVNAIGGDVFLIGKTVTNSGTISAPQGMVGLAAGSEVLIAVNPDANGERVFVRAGSSGSMVDNSGSISAAAVELKAHGNPYALAINNSGSIRATGVNRSGGHVFLRATGGKIDNSGSIRATMPGGNGGRILIESAIANISGTLDASGIGNGNGGQINVNAEDVTITGNILANGIKGGTIAIAGPEGVAAKTVTLGGSAVLSANGTDGVGGEVTVLGDNVVTSANSLISASGTTNGGLVRVTGVKSATIGGAINVGGESGFGGQAIVEGGVVSLGQSASIEAIGGIGGGSVNVGGGFQGKNLTVLNAKTTTVEAGARIAVDAIQSGNAGTAVVWADQDTLFLGDISAQALGMNGDGGMVEVSGKQSLQLGGGVSTFAANGNAGTLLLDPTNFTINAAERTTIQNAINGGGNVVVTTNSIGPGLDAGDIFVNAALTASGSGNLSLLAHRNINVNYDWLNDGSGNINLVAGWDGVTALGAAPNGISTPNDVAMFDDFFTSNVSGTGNAGAFGNNNGTISLVAATANQQISVGSAGGQTNLAAYDLVMTAGSAVANDDRSVQIGNDRVSSSGAITIELLNDLTMSKTDNARARNYTQIGHGGRSRNFDQSGAITVFAGNNISATAGNGGDDYTQIGNGGRTSVAAFSGAIDVLAGGAITFSGGAGTDAYAQLGHGGTNARGDHSGAINVEAVGAVTFSGSAGVRSYAQIGHGGYDADGPDNGANNTQGNSGIITVSGSDVIFTGGAGASNTVYSYAQIGHGGAFTKGAHDGEINVTATTGKVEFLAGIGSVYVNDSRAYAQIGHGGYDADGNHRGAITVNAGSNGGVGVNFVGGNGDDDYVQLGHGGMDSRSGTDAAPQGLIGAITVNSVGSITFTAGSGINDGTSNDDHRLYALLGHGGYNTDPSGSDTNYFADPNWGHSGAISVTSSMGDIVFTGGGTGVGADNTGRFHFAQLGHGGYAAGGNHNGNITVEATVGAVNFTGGGLSVDDNGGFYNYAQLGHGGAEDQGNLGVAGDVIKVTAGAGGITFSGGSGTQTYALLGNGGYNFDGGHHSDIIVTTTDGGNITFKGSQVETSLNAFAQLGNGGRLSNSSVSQSSHTGDITVSSSGAISFLGGSGNVTYAQLGNGGDEAKSSNTAGHSGKIQVSAVNDINFLAGTYGVGNSTDARNYVMLGNGGYNADGSDNDTYVSGIGHSGDLFVTTTLGSINFYGGDTTLNGGVGIGTGRTHFAQLGNGGYGSVGDHYGDITVNSANEIHFQAGSSNDDALETYNYAQLGHGGAFARGIHGWGDTDGDGVADGDINVLAGGDIVFTAGRFFDSSTTAGRDENRRSYVQIGHGGFDADRSNPGGDAASILMPDGNFYFFDGYNVGGPTADERMGSNGNITIESIDGSIKVKSGETHDSYAIFGHGGGTSQGSTDGDQTGNIIVKADVDGSNRAGGGGNIFFWVDDPNTFDGTLNIYDRRYVQLGHGGHYVSGGHNGDITVIAGNALDFRAGGGDSYAQLGHGGRNDHRLNYTLVDGPVPGNSSDNDSDSNYTTIGVNGDNPPDDRREAGNDRYYSGTHSGDINVATWGDISFIGYSNLVTNDGGVGYAQIGHGGFRNAADPLSANGAGHNGDITVLAGGLTFNDVSGTVTAAQNANATITFESGMQVYSYAQIGNGGYEAFGNHSGDIIVAAAAGVDFHAMGGQISTDDNRSGRYSYLQIGHGGLNADFDPFLPRALESTNNTVGNVFGEDPATNLFYANSISGTQLPGALGPDGVPLTGQGSLMPLTTFNQIYVDPTTIRFVDHDNNPLTPMIPIVPRNSGQWFNINAPGAPVDGSGNYIIGNSGDIQVAALSGPINLSSAPDTAARGREAYVQIGHGGLFTGGDHTGDISVIAQNGDVNIQAGMATINDGALNSYAQVGHGGSWSGGNMSGNIAVKALGAGHQVVGTAGSDNQNYLLIGHGGYDANFLYGAGTQLSGPDANGVTVADIRAISGTTLQGNHLQYWYNPDFVGRNDLRSAVAGDPDNALSDPLKFGFFSGNISVVGADGVSIAGSTAGSASASIAPSAFAQIGHGGRSTQSHSSGNIIVDASGTDPLNGGAIVGAGGVVTATAGNSDQNYVQIGHGGYDGDGNHGTRDVDGDTVIDGDITVKAGANSANEGIVFRGGSRGDTYAQLGHGGTLARSANWMDLTGADGTGGPDGLADSAGNQGNINVISEGSVIFAAGTGSLVLNGDFDWINYAQLGHGGYDADVHTQVGGGGLAADATFYGTNIGHHGDINVESTNGRVIFYAGDPNRPEYASAGAGGGRLHYAQLGHGGYATRGSHYGNITVAAASDILFSGGAGDTRQASEGLSFAQLGHGGRSGAFGDLGSRDANGDATETISVTSGRDIFFEGGVGQENYAQLGNGGRDARGDHAANIEVSAGRDIIFTASQSDHLNGTGRLNTNSYTRNSADGNGLADATNNLAGVAETIQLYNESIVPGSVVFTVLAAPTSLGSTFTDVRDAAPNSFTGTIQAGDGTIVGTVNYVTGVLTITAPMHTGTDTANNIRVAYQHADADLAYVQLGNGGYDSDNGNGNSVGNVGDILVDAGGDVRFSGGGGFGAYAHLGHGGYETIGRNRGDITLGTNRDGILGNFDDRIGGAVVLSGGRGSSFFDTDAYAMIGHGGDMNAVSSTVSMGTQTGNITINAGTGIAPELAGVGVQVQAGTREDAFAMIGHGGTNARSGTAAGVAGMEGNSGAITIDAIGSVNLIGGVLNKDIPGRTDDGRLYAQIGHGGYDADVSWDAVIAANGIGHNGDISVLSRLGSVNVLGGDHLRADLPSFAPTHDGIAGGRFHWAQIGHGGYSATGNHFGNITVNAGFDFNGVSTNGAANSDINVLGGGAFDDQDASQQYAQIGHGGRGANVFSGNLGLETDVISVMANGDVSVIAGNGIDNYAMIGNGGTQTRGDHAGDIQVFAEGNVTAMASQFTATPGAGAGLVGGYSFVSLTDGTNSIDLAANLGLGGDFTLRFNRVTTGSIAFDVFNDAGVKIGEVVDNGVVNGDGTRQLSVVSNFTELVDGLQLNADDVVGFINYGNGDNNAPVITFTRDINPSASDGTANLAVRFEYAQTDRAYAMIGHGGWEADFVDGNAELGNTGDIRITARTGDAEFKAGTDNQSFLQVGHGGYNTRGANSGDIVIRVAGDISLLGGTGSAVDDDKRIFSQIGHGGWDADGATLAGVGHTGAIKLSSGSGALTTSVGDLLGDYNDLGDFNGDGVADVVQFGADVSGNAGGVGSGVGILIQGGNGTAIDDDLSASVGHGGRSSGGNHDGAIAVTASKGISLISGTGYRAWTQIGHGGLAETGNLSGDISVIADGDNNGSGNIRLQSYTGPGATDTFALIGHGGRPSTDAGNRSGNILIQAVDFELPNNPFVVSNTGALFGHQSTTANEGIDQSGANPVSFQMIATGVGLAPGARTNFTITDAIRDNLVTPYLGSGGNVTLSATGDLTNNSAIAYSSVGNFNLLAGLNLDINRLIQNSRATGGGSVNLMAGWDGISGFDVPLYFNDCPPTHTYTYASLKPLFDTDSSSFGNNDGSVSIGDNAAAVAVGSASGDTNVAGFEVDVRAGDTTDEYAQIGFRNVGTSPATGNIMVDTKDNGITLTGGTAGDRTYAQIGHGGADTDTSLDADLSGMIVVNATRGTTPGNIDLTAGAAGTNRYAMIGHGGTSQGSNIAGSIEVLGNDVSVVGGAGGTLGNFAQIGHGGYSGTGTKTGAVDVTSSGEILVKGGNSVGNYAQIGNGGYTNTGAITGDVVVTTTGGGVTVATGTGTDASAQIGNGGRGQNGLLTGDVVVEATGNVLVDATGSTNINKFAQIGNGGLVGTGGTAGTTAVSTRVTTDGTITLLGGDAGNNYAVIGAGGAGFDGNKTNAGVLVEGSAITLTSGTGPAAYTQIGSGGGVSSSGNNAVGNVTGDVTVTATAGAITATASSSAAGVNAFTQIGNGGAESDGNFAGEVNVTAVTDISFNGGAGAGAYAQLGHGGWDGTAGDANGTRDGNIIAHTTTGNFSLNSGAGAGAYSQAGHGGFQNDGNIGSNAASGIYITADAGSIAFNSAAGVNACSQIGHGDAGAISTGNRTGDIYLNGPLGITSASPTGVATAIGHRSAGGVLDGDYALVTSANLLNLQSRNLFIDGGADDFATLFDPANIPGPASMSIANNLVYTGEINLNLWSTGDLNLLADVANAGGGDINLVSGWDGVTGIAGDPSASGALFNPNHTAPLPVSFTLADFAAVPSPVTSWGNGNAAINIVAASTGSAKGNTNVLGYGITLDGGTGAAQIGFNEEIFKTLTGIDGKPSNGAINLTTKDNGLTLNSGAIAGASTQVGHGGAGTNANQAGAINIDLMAGGVLNAGALALDSGAGTGASAQIGHGGAGARGAKTADIAITASSVNVIAGSGIDAFAQIGNGGTDAIGQGIGDITVTALTGNLAVRGGTGTDAYAQIGNGGHEAQGNQTGSISINSAEDVDVIAGAADGSVAQIGHGGTRVAAGALGLSNDEIVVNAAGNVNVTASDTGVGSGAQIGNGGLAVTTVLMSSDVFVNAGADINIQGGAAQFAAAQIGHGGPVARGGKTGDLFVNAGNDVTLTGGAGNALSTAQIGNGDRTGSGTGVRNGDIQVTAGEDIILTNAVIGHVDKTLAPVLADSGSTYLAASRNDPTTLGTGVINIDSDSAVSSANTDELRFYLPNRAANQIEVGANLNGVDYAGVNPDPNFQLPTEFAVTAINPASGISTTVNQHTNLANWSSNFTTSTVSPDTSNYTASASFYYDTITASLIPIIIPPVDPPVDPTDPVVPVDPTVDPGIGIPGASPFFGGAGGVDLFVVDGNVGFFFNNQFINLGPVNGGLNDQEEEEHFYPRRRFLPRGIIVKYEPKAGYESTHNYVPDSDGMPIFTGYFSPGKIAIQDNDITKQIESLENQLRSLGPIGTAIVGSEEDEPEVESKEPKTDTAAPVTEPTAKVTEPAADPFGAE